MTCPTCNASTPPGAHCDGNGTHSPRRARRLSGEEKRAAQREVEARREAERTRATLVEVARPVVESGQQRRYLYRRGELAAELAEAVSVGLLTPEGAAELEARTAREVEALDAENARRRAEYDAWLGANPPADAVEVGKRVEPPSEPSRRPSRDFNRTVLTLALAGAFLGTMPPEDR